MTNLAGRGEQYLEFGSKLWKEKAVCMILITTNSGFPRDSTNVGGKPTVLKLHLKHILYC